jgi:hypothetical protein
MSTYVLRIIIGKVEYSSKKKKKKKKLELVGQQVMPPDLLFAGWKVNVVQ